MYDNELTKEKKELIEGIQKFSPKKGDLIIVSMGQDIPVTNYHILSTHLEKLLPEGVKAILLPSNIQILEEFKEKSKAGRAIMEASGGLDIVLKKYIRDKSLEKTKEK